MCRAAGRRQLWASCGRALNRAARLQLVRVVPAPQVNAAVEGTVNKVRRQLMDLQASVAPEDRADVWVEGQTPEGYLQVGRGRGVVGLQERSP